MKQNIKITKREMKEDKFTTFMLMAKEYATERWIYFAAGAGAVIIIVLGMVFFRSYQTSQEQKAIETYNRAKGELYSGNYQLAIVDFKAVVDEYGSTDMAGSAAFNLANAYFGAKNYPEAKTAFEAYLSNYADDPYFTTSAMAGVAECLAASGDLVGAADKYRETAEKYPSFKLAGEFYLKAMECYVKAGNLESAKVVFAKINSDFQDTRYYLEGARLAAENKIQL
jgi:TolA-binding protein